MLFVIAGHGAGDPGACAHGYQEAERVRALAARMGELGGSKVFICDTSRDWFRDGGISTALFGDNAQIIELHLDAHTDLDSRGGSVRIKPGIGGADDYDVALANFIGGVFPNQLGKMRGVVEQPLSNADRAYLRGIPYRLLECCFISNAGDIAKFNNNLDDIARGILAAFHIAAVAPDPAPSPETVEWYRVRTSSNDAKGQVGAFKNLENAKKAVDDRAVLTYPVQAYSSITGLQVYP